MSINPGIERMSVSFSMTYRFPLCTANDCINDWQAKKPRAMKKVPEERKAMVVLSTPFSSTVMERTKIQKDATSNTVCHHFKLRLWNTVSIGGGSFSVGFFSQNNYTTNDPLPMNTAQMFFKKSKCYNKGE